MLIKPQRSRSLLQRRSSMSNSVQALLDGIGVLGLAYWLIHDRTGSLSQHYVILLMLLMGFLAVIYDHTGIYRSNGSIPRKAFALFKAWSLAFSALLVIGYLSKQSEAFSRLVMGELYVGGYFLQLGLHLAMRWVQQQLLHFAHEPEHSLIIGSGRLARYLTQQISGNPWLGERIIGFVPLENENAEPDTAQTPLLPQVGTLDDLPRLIEERQIRTVYFVTQLASSEALERLYFTLLDKHVTIHWVPDIFSLKLLNHSVREIAGIPLLTLSETPLIGGRRAMKAAEDYILSSMILLLIAPLLLAVAIAVKLDSPGPVFFRQARAGWNGRNFRIWKFRSMYVHQPQEGVVKQATRDDPRITRVGRFIRRTSLDELPQIFNVLTGDMSLVGPRPHALQHDELYAKQISDYFARRNIKPGITGLAQVRGFRGETQDLEQMIQRVESDIEYINNWSVSLDLSILLRTTLAFTGKYAY